MDAVRVPVRIFFGVGMLSVHLIAFWALWKYYTKKEKIPTVWRKVGKLSDMMCFPVKSGGVIRLDEMECTNLGLRLNWLRDRSFMIVNSKGNFVSARIHPKLVLVKPQVEDDQLILQAPEMKPLKISINNNSEKNTKVTLWGITMNCLDSGEEAAKWFSQYLLGAESGLRLVHCPQDYIKMQKSRDKSIVKANDSGAFPDLTSFCLINENSIKDLNTRLSKPVTAQQFRPNFLVTGTAAPYEEDNWKWVRIGDVVFQAVKLCTRCIFTTINAETGEKDENQEPLATLKKYRMAYDPIIKMTNKNSPVMGIHLALRKGGFVKIGDTIEVA